MSCGLANELNSTMVGMLTESEFSRSSMSWVSSHRIFAELSRHDPDVANWDALSADQKKLYARMMEVFCGISDSIRTIITRCLFNLLKSIWPMEEHADHVHFRQRSQRGGWTNRISGTRTSFSTMCRTLEQNLAMIDQLGGPTTFNHYAWGWTFAGNTPFCCWCRRSDLNRGPADYESASQQQIKMVACLRFEPA